MGIFMKIQSLNTNVVFYLLACLGGSIVIKNDKNVLKM